MYEMDTANHTDETKWLLPAYMVDKPHQPKYSQDIEDGAIFKNFLGALMIIAC